MRTLYRTVLPTPPPNSTKSPFSHFLSLKTPFLFSPPPKQFFPSLQNLNPLHSKIARPIIITSSSSLMASSTTETKTKKPFSVLFVCLGNICRSPAAEGVFRDLVKKRGLDSKFTIDSAGTINYHEGNEADPRMRAASKRRGIQITSLSRPIKPSDFVEFDLILAMDRQNKGVLMHWPNQNYGSEDILAALERWSFKETLPADAYKKVRLMCSYCKKHEETEVPDPYYGGAQGFEKVLDLLVDGCESLLESILAENPSISA
ncbi:hypothetical protein LguiA_012393 [Lonicera macranthoides]